MPVLCAMAAVFLLDLTIKNKIEAADPSAFPQKRFGCTIKRLHNRGMMLNALESRPGLVKALSLAAFLLALILCLPYVWKKGDLLFRLALGLLLGGALSNLYDHFKRGYVVDYVSLPIPKLQQIVFNLSDFCIFFGAVFCFFRELFRG